ncbi:MAG: DUF1501 domain-containing protein [Pirellulales bacterium]|nr:DUF1501 domain-containing protein [Pirellulales bacterium]
MAVTPLSRVLSRRHFLQIGGWSLGAGAGLGLSQLLAAQTQAQAPAPRADACILLFLNGGPSHLDMWDMKPDAPDGIRGEFKPIATSVPGYTMCELLPRLAALADQATVVRSMHHGVNNAHAAAVYAALTGHDRGEQGGGTQPTDNPAPGSVLAKLRPPRQAVLPHVTLPYVTKEGAGGPPQPGFFGGYLGTAYDPLFVVNDPNADNFSVDELNLRADMTPDRLAARQGLFAGLSAAAGGDAGLAAWEAMNAHQRRAFDLLRSTAMREAFALSREPDPVREAYGRNIYGQSVLLARRLIEAGTRLVCVSWAPDANATWDTHGGNFQRLRDSLLPQLDAACGSLVVDLRDRGLLERTVVAVMGDFGRTPKINASAGRDHWNYCYSVMMFGGGFRQGLIYGASDKIGAFPALDPITPGHLISTLYHALGIPPELELHDRLDRPHRLVPTGEVVPELLS